LRLPLVLKLRKSSWFFYCFFFLHYFSGIQWCFIYNCEYLVHCVSAIGFKFNAFYFG